AGGRRAERDVAAPRAADLARGRRRGVHRRRDRAGDPVALRAARRRSVGLTHRGLPGSAWASLLYDALRGSEHPMTTAPGKCPCSAELAVQRALSILDQGGEYELGGGDYCPSATDLPWTRSRETGRLVCDCSGFAISWCYQIPRHRPGFNRGSW